MSENELDSLPKKVRLGMIGKKEASMIVMKTLYMNPARFQLQSMDEDDRSEFLMDMLPKFEALLERHCESISPFGAYLYYSISGLKLTWIKKKIDSQRIAIVMKRSVRELYERPREKPSLSVAQPSSKIAEPKRASRSSAMQKIFDKKSSAFIIKNNVYEKRSALILALKSAWYIDESHIEKVCDFCGCPKNEVFEKIQLLRSNLIEKSEKHKSLVEKRDKAWYFVCKYRDKLARMNKNCKSYEDQKRRLSYQLKAWKKTNFQLQNSMQKICPDNGSVARILNISPQKISKYVSYAKRVWENQSKAM